MNNKVRFDLINKYRTELMGIATLMVFACHIRYVTGDDPINVILKIMYEGSVGVDIFLFLSGIGLCYSFSKNENILDFYKRRAKRIIPAYLPVALIFFTWEAVLHNEIGFWKCMFKISTLSYWDNKIGFPFWYVAYIIMFYLFYPFVYKHILKSPIRSVAFLIVLFATNVLMILFCSDIYLIYGLFLARMPITFVGCATGKIIFNKKEDLIRNKYIVALLLPFVIIRILRVLYIPECNANWVTFFVKTANMYGVIAFVYGYSFFRDYMDKENAYKLFQLVGAILKNILSFFGKYSLEIYIIHVAIMEITEWYSGEMSIVAFFLVLPPVTCLLAVLERKFINMIIFWLP